MSNTQVTTLISYTKRFLTGNLAGLTVEASFSVPYPVNHFEVHNYMSALTYQNERNPGHDTITGDAWVIAGAVRASQNRCVAAQFVGLFPTGQQFEDAGGVWNQDFLTWMFPDGSYGRMDQHEDAEYAFVVGLADPGFAAEVR